MPFLHSLRNSRHWLPFARLYQRSGLKARVYSRRLVPPVKTLSQAALFQRLGLDLKRCEEGWRPDFHPPVPVESGPMPEADAVFFARFIRALAPQDIFEFGTNWGVATAILARNTPATAHIHTLDVCREMFSAEHLAADPELQMILPQAHTGWRYRQEAPEIAEKVTQVFADSMTYAMPPEPKCDFVLVDACHRFEYVEKDTQNTQRCIAPGGCVLWHDYYSDVSSWVDVFRFMSSFAKEHQNVFHIEGTHFAFWQAPDA